MGMQSDHRGAVTLPDRVGSIEIGLELPAWADASADPDEFAPAQRLERLLADMPDEFRLEPLGVIEAELHRHPDVAR
jgi:hypothetical protein